RHGGAIAAEAIAQGWPNPRKARLGVLPNLRDQLPGQIENFVVACCRRPEIEPFFGIVPK
ncbi:hypothetical protein, partial [Azonexus sp.]|uniref:hypothetical protein n=1 Tax=Azonexus sp. TaxID=1872668 RepID=UPI00283A8ED0